MTITKSRKIALITTFAAVGTMLIIGISIGGFAFYLVSSRQYCSNYASNNQQKTGLPESMSYYSLYNPCMESKGLKNL